MSKKIVITPRGYANFGDEAGKKLIAKGYELDINRTGNAYSNEEFIAHCKDAVGVIFGIDDLSENSLKQLPNLKAAVKFGVGLDNIDQDYCKQHDIKVGRCVGANSNAVAEYTVTMMLNCMKKVCGNVITVKQGEWVKPTGFELTNKTVGIIGFGNIGKIVAKICSYGFGMNVLVYDVFNIPQESLDECKAKCVTLEEIYKNSDVITVHVPLIDSTRNMISKEQFSSMKDNVVIINPARGGIINEKDLYDALVSKKVFAAAADVFSSEPPSKEDWAQKLIALDNFYLTSHIAARTKEAELNCCNIATDEIIKLLEN